MIVSDKQKVSLKEFFEVNKKAALAFSGGVDSAFLLYAGLKYGCDICAYYVRTEFQPEFEYSDAKRLISDLKAYGFSPEMRVLELSVLSDEEIAANPENRCYFCKKIIFGSIKSRAVSEGYKVLIDGTNASDDCADRPGMKAKDELEVLSPLRDAGLTKEKIRDLSKEAGLFTWNKPSYACLATRMEAGSRITKEGLKITESAENDLSQIGFSDFRIRMKDGGGTALIQLKDIQKPLYFEKKQEIEGMLLKYYRKLILDESVHR